MSLQKTLSEFALSDASRENIMKGDITAPAEFEQAAKIALAGHFLVKGFDRDIIVRPTCIEFYYHEEFENGIKDYIVYHRNSQSSQYMPFPIGTLHNHVSGIDITFEKGESSQDAIRASMLVREFETDGCNEHHSTLLYEALYQQSSIFSGISLQWVDGEQAVEVVSYPRKNVAVYSESGQKIPAKEHPDLPCTDDKKFIQDQRRWQFRRKLISDADTNKVYLSAWLKDECPNFYERFTVLLSEQNIPFGIMQNTSDIWARDYMPIQIYDDLYVQYHYNPDYLRRKRLQQYITDTNSVCKELGIETIKTDLVIDGGNVVKIGKYVIMTEKVYAENSTLKPVEVRNLLKSLFHCDLILLPWDKNEKYGHADGLVKAIDDETVLLTNYADYDKGLADKISARLKQHLNVKTLHYSTKSNEANWAYINYLRVGNTIILPALGISEDEEALQQVKAYHPSCNVFQIECSELIKKGGGLNCITWTTKTTER